LRTSSSELFPLHAEKALKMKSQPFRISAHHRGTQSATALDKGKPSGVLFIFVIFQFQYATTIGNLK
jgi:hypothetical protein